LLILLVAIGIFVLRPRSRAAQLFVVASAISSLTQSMLWAGNTIGGAYSDTQPAVWIAESIPLYSAGWVFLPALLLLILQRRADRLKHSNGRRKGESPEMLAQ
jgi:hypothetical protein